jgi:hypothetical protein
MGFGLWIDSGAKHLKPVSRLPCGVDTRREFCVRNFRCIGKEF